MLQKFIVLGILIFIAIGLATTYTKKEPVSQGLSPATVSPSEPANLTLILPIYNDQMATLIETTFRSYIKNSDIFYINSGGTGRLNMEWVNNTINRLKQSFPNNTIVSSTSGLKNVTTISAQTLEQVETINYNYEPNFANIPEFSWNFSTTLSNIDKAAATARSDGKKLMISPTGRPLLQTNLLKYNWNYGVIGQHVDSQIIQTQTYCKKNVAKFQEAIDKLIIQYGGSTLNWSPQITVSKTNVNGVSPQRGYDCTMAVVNAGLPSLSIWWHPNDSEYLEQYFQLIDRGPNPSSVDKK